MGNTIRREPVSSRIPASPDYKYLNITDFRGVDISDNPFTLSSNTASDVLNLYVDETNTLTTRPRLKLVHELKKIHPHMTRLLGIYPLSFGYLYHYIENGSYAMDVAHMVDDVLSFYHVDTDTNAVNPKEEKLMVFEQDDNIYILSKDGYYVITYSIVDDVVVRPILDDVSGYVPTTTVGGTQTTTGTVFEPLNLLIDKYKETYFWDGTWSPTDKKTTDTDTIDNDYKQQYEVLLGKNEVPRRLLENSISAMDKKSLVGGTFLVKKSSSMYLYSLTSEQSISVKKDFGRPTDMPDQFDMLYGDCSMDGDAVIYYYRSENTSSESADGGVYYSDSSGWKTLIKSKLQSCNVTEDPKQHKYAARISADGSILAYVFSEENDTKDVVVVKNKDGVLSPIYNHTHSAATIDNTDITHINLSRNGDVLIVYGMKNVYVVSGLLTNNIKLTTIPIIEGTDAAVCVSDDGNLLCLTNAQETHIYQKTTANLFEKVSLSQKINDVLRFANVVEFTQDSKKLYIVNHTDPSKEGWLILNALTDAEHVATPISGGVSQQLQLMFFANDFYVTGTPASSTTHKLAKTSFLFDSKEPLLTITHTMTSKHPEYSVFMKHRLNIRSALLSLRFDNERWFAVKNKTYHTLNNDPTYIGLNTVNYLGETDEDITGFNLVQDNLMVVYKDNRIWAISPQTYTSVDGQTIYDYAYQETKNTVGNNAIGASIVSAYSEIPLQIAYDGIYGLKQLTNVYATDRISESLSDAIAVKWLKEDKSVIRNAKTINRLYWTYVILPYNDLTKTYLLDNRTGAWFYWEFPIKVVNAFVKDNIAHMTDEQGNLYQLTTKDIVTEYSTEYYDAGKKIINWHWKSQILPLGTINYSKKLIDTTFVFTDTDANDEYGLNYTYYAYRRGVSKTNETTISNTLNYVQSTTKKTLIPRINFVQLELSNVVDDLNNNKLRLVGLGLKYVLLEGLL